MAEGSPSRLRQAGSHFASRGSTPGNSEQQNYNYGERDSPTTRGGGAGVGSSRDQAQSALDGLLSDNQGVQGAPTSYNYRPAVENATTANRSPEATRARRLSFRPDLIGLGGPDGTRREPSSSGLLSPGGAQSPGSPGGGGYTPTAAAGRRYVRATRARGRYCFRYIVVATPVSRV